MLGTMPLEGRRMIDSLRSLGLSWLSSCYPRCNPLSRLREREESILFVCEKGAEEYPHSRPLHVPTTCFTPYQGPSAKEEVALSNKP